MRRYAYSGPILREEKTEPFITSEEAWLWYAQCQLARDEGARIWSGRGATSRPCDPDDIAREVRRLYRHRVLGAEHMRALAHYGRRQQPPGLDAREARALRLWGEALDRLAEPLRLKGIVA